MTASQVQVCVWRESWHQDFRIYGGKVCNTLMAGSWADRTPLHDAALQGRLLPLKRLLSQGLHAGVVTLDGVTPLHEACLGGHLACAKLLLDHGADASAVCADGATPLFNACCSGNPALVRLLLLYSSAHHPAHLRNSPVHEAAKRGHTACVEVLLTHGVNADVQVPGIGTPLYCACETRSLECVRLLLILGADVHCGRGLDTPLHAAVRACGAMEVEMLLEHGADGKCRNSEGKTPMDMATDNNIKHLLQTAGPCSLSHLSRLCIRRTLGQKRLRRTLLYV
ncbi:ankyrin repeat and SOCS box protein 11 isoform X2 [Brachyhypopomus gauderio]|uniref:ankyrin repeat and SOCS box protein 11 isoform X2 n=1 Tax=Brachyhypopomus gauderio TaxID=698409 RepID=UPI0040438568